MSRKGRLSSLVRSIRHEPNALVVWQSDCSPKDFMRSTNTILRVVSLSVALLLMPGATIGGLCAAEPASAQSCEGKCRTPEAMPDSGQSHNCCDVGKADRTQLGPAIEQTSGTMRFEARYFELRPSASLRMSFVATMNVRRGLLRHKIKHPDIPILSCALLI